MSEEDVAIALENNKPYEATEAEIKQEKQFEKLEQIIQADERMASTRIDECELQSGLQANKNIPIDEGVATGVKDQLLMRIMLLILAGNENIHIVFNGKAWVENPYYNEAIRTQLAAGYRRLLSTFNMNFTDLRKITQPQFRMLLIDSPLGSE